MNINLNVNMLYMTPRRENAFGFVMSVVIIAFVVTVFILKTVCFHLMMLIMIAHLEQIIVAIN
jgi:hypothetical protein